MHDPRSRQVLIITTAHDPEDGRLVRHASTLEAAGWTVEIVAKRSTGRISRVLGSGAFVARSIRASQPDIVIFPDPELFVIGSAIARLLGVKVINDIHEDYAAVARSRDWLPRPIGVLLAVPVRLWMWIGRLLSNRTVVAAEHLRRREDVVVLNVPVAVAEEVSGPRPELVYVGDVTLIRGVDEMVNLSMATGVDLLIVGPIDPAVRERVATMLETSGATTKIEFAGRLPYVESWRRAVGALAGLSLLHDTPAYREAIPSKVYEYLGVGLPVIVSDLPAQAETVRRLGVGAVVSDLGSAVSTVRGWLDSPDEWQTVATRCLEAARELAAGPADALVGAVERLASTD